MPTYLLFPTALIEKQSQFLTEHLRVAGLKPLIRAILMQPSLTMIKGQYRADVVELINPKVTNSAVVFTIKSLDNVQLDTQEELAETAVNNIWSSLSYEP